MNNTSLIKDYYPFGMVMPGRSFGNSGYRFGFNGKENDNEVKGDGGQQDYGMRMYDPRVARFLSVDPLSHSFPMLTPYQFASNTPIQAIDLDGLEARKVTTVDPNTGKTIIEITVDMKVKNSSKLITNTEAIKLAGKVVSELSTSFSGETNLNTEIILKANITNLRAEGNAGVELDEFSSEGSFYIDFVDYVEGTSENSNVTGQTATIGNSDVNRFQIRVAANNSSTLKRGLLGIVRTGIHELGHGLGLRHPWDPLNDITDMDQLGADSNYEPANKVSSEGIKNNVMNSDANENTSLRPSGNAKGSTKGQRNKIAETVPEKK